MSQDEKQHNQKEMAALESLKNIDTNYVYDTISAVLDNLHPDIAKEIVKELHFIYCKGGCRSSDGLRIVYHSIKQGGKELL